jgi:hypothetical protein
VPEATHRSLQHGQLPEHFLPPAMAEVKLWGHRDLRNAEAQKMPWKQSALSISVGPKSSDSEQAP